MTAAASRPWRAWGLLGVAGVCVFVGVAALRPIHPVRNNDLFLHLTTGRLILEEADIPTRDRYSFTAPGARYVPHEWLAQVAYALAERAGGWPGLLAVGLLAPALAVLALLFFALRASGIGLADAAALALLAAAAARHRLLLRPELVAILLFVAVLALLLRHRRLRGRGSPSYAVWWVVPLQLVWVNVHGSFPLGVCLTATFAAAGAFERLRLRSARAARAATAGAALVAGATALALRGAEPTAFGVPAACLVALGACLAILDAWRPWLAPSREDAAVGGGPLLALVALQTGAMLANPFGVEMLAFPFEFTTGASAVTRSVLEWRPWLERVARVGAGAYPVLGNPSTLLFLAVGFLALARAAVRGRLARLPLLLLLGLSFLPLRHARWVALTTLGSLPALGLVLASLRAREGPAVWGRVHRVAAALLAAPALAALVAGAWIVARLPLDAAPLAALAALAVCGAAASFGRARPHGTLREIALVAPVLLIAVLSLVPGLPETAGGRPWRAGPGVRDVAPVPAVGFLADVRLGGRLCTEYAWSGYALYRLWPGVRVQIDSRSEVYGDAGLAAHLRARRDLASARSLLPQCDLALLSYRPGEPSAASALVRAAQEDADLGLVFFDDASLVFARGTDGPPPFRLLDPVRPLPDASALGDPRALAEALRAVELAPDAAVTHALAAAALGAAGRPAEARALLADARRRGLRSPQLAQLAAGLRVGR